MRRFMFLLKIRRHAGRAGPSWRSSLFDKAPKALPVSYRNTSVSPVNMAFSTSFSLLGKPFSTTPKDLQRGFFRRIFAFCAC
jgi:hypothetical protein